MWDFETDPEFQAKLDWADAFLTNELLKSYSPSKDLFPSYHLPTRRAAIAERFAHVIEAQNADHEIAEL